MSLENKINEEIKTAMKAKDSAALRSLRAVKNAILLAKTDGSGKEIDEQAEIKILQKLVKQRKESLSIYEEQNREDLAAKEREEIEVIEQFLPQALSREELEEKVSSIISQLGAEGMKDMGKVMGKASQELAGRADGKTLAEVVKSQLT
jgi:uncharacterized protein YqeY